MRSRPSEILGYVDHAGDGLIRGWAADLRATRSKLALDVFRHGIYLGCARAGMLRLDLREQGIGDGCYGFVFHSPALAAADATDGLEVIASDAGRTRLTISAMAHTGTDPDPMIPRPVHEVRSFFGPLLEAIVRGTDPSNASCFTPRSTMNARMDSLFAATPGEPVSPFAAHIAVKYRTCASNDSFWLWYLETYGMEQAARTPLSSNDIDLLQARFVDRAFGRVRRRETFGRREHLYGWCVHESRRLKVEDCLVDSEAIEALRTLPLMARCSAYPLSHFMRLQRRHHPLLGRCPIGTRRDRIAFYAVLMLLALRDVHYLGFMPALWLDRMLARSSAGSPFEQAQRALFGFQAPLLPPDSFCERVEAMGFDLSRKRFRTFVSKGHRLVMMGRPADAPAVDVQMIGPFRQSLGLAESCRRIARALRATGLSLNLVDYRIGSRPQNVPSEFDAGPIRRARINVLHLNAEEVPEAMVSLPGLLGDAHIIVVPYWELDRPSQAHRLGLDLVDEIWCTTHFLETVFAGAKPVCHIGMCVDDRDAPTRLGAEAGLGGERADGFTVLCVADALSWVQRKNLLGAVTAFQSAFEGDATARLIVKTRNTGHAPPTSHGDAWRTIVARCQDDPRIEILDADIDAREHKALLARADCLLSLHRAEGLGLDMLDAMHLGTPVVATAYSGNMDFCSAETAWLVDYDLVPVAAGQYAFVEAGHVWAEPRLESAVVALRAVRDDPTTRVRKTRAAGNLVRAQASPAGLAARLSSLLRARLAAGEAAR